MTAHLLLLLAAAPTPTPTSDELDPLTVSPGLVGFLATFAVAVATVLLVVDMTRRVRRLRFREEQERRRQEEAAAASERDDLDRPEPPPPVVS